MTAPSLAYDKISPTAKLVAYWRSFSDIPFSKDIALLFNCKEVVNSFFKAPGGTLDDLLVPLVELRYKCIQNLILKLKLKQVLEFASGISLRGLAMTKDPELIYVETDLATLNEEKSRLLKTIMEKHTIKNRHNLFFHAVNILDIAEITPSLGHFNLNKPLAVVHEGLFQYLSHDEKKQAARNIHEVLKRFGGMWITPDLDTKRDRLMRDIDKEHFQPIMDSIARMTGRDFLDNAFEDESHLYSFFDELGFSIEQRPQFDDELKLTSCHNKELSTAALENLKTLKLWVLRPKAS